MSTFSKIAGVAAVLAATATSALAVQIEETAVPSSLRNSGLVESSNISSVTVFKEHVAPAASLNPVVVNQLKDGQTTEIASTLDGQIPASLSGSRLVQN